MEDFGAIVPSPQSAFVPLARVKSGKLYRKHILSTGTLIHPVTKEDIDVDDAFLTSLATNFTGGVCDIVQVPLADANNDHTEAPDRNIGEVIGLEVEDDKLYATIDARKPEAADQLGKTLLGASAYLHTNYTDTRTGDKVGPTLLHVAVTNRPYVVGLEDYEELIAATADSPGDIVLLTSKTEEEPPKMPTLDEIKAALKSDHNIDLDALQLSAVAPTPPPAGGGVDAAALIKALSDVGALKLTAGQDPEAAAEQLTDQDVVNAVVELAQDNVLLSQSHVALTGRLDVLETDKVNLEVDALVIEGRILPAQKEAMAELALSNRAMFDKLVPETPLISLSHEVGNGGAEEREPDADVQAAIDKYTTGDGVAVAGGYIRK